MITPGDTIEVVGTHSFCPFTVQTIRIWGNTVSLRRRARMPIL